MFKPLTIKELESLCDDLEHIRKKITKEEYEKILKSLVEK